MATGFRGMPLTGTQAGMVPACQAEGARVAAGTRQKEGQMGVLTKIQGRQLTWGPELVAALVARGAQGRLGSGWHFFVSGMYRDCSLEALDRNVNVTVHSPQCDARNFQVGCLPVADSRALCNCPSTQQWALAEDRDKDPADCSKFSL